jgi:hypothetical protein
MEVNAYVLNNITSGELRQLISIVERKERPKELREIESSSTYLSPGRPSHPRGLAERENKSRCASKRLEVNAQIKRSTS